MKIRKKCKLCGHVHLTEHADEAPCLCCGDVIGYSTFCVIHKTILEVVSGHLICPECELEIHPSIFREFPFEGFGAKRRQEEVAKSIGLPVDLSVQLPNGVKVEFVLIPEGGFMMGSPQSEQDRDRDESLHPVRITKPFYMAKYECTQAEWEAITGENPSCFKDNPRNPVERVSWNDINNTFLPAIQKHAPSGMTFRLPTEAQWEYACRAGTSTPFHFGVTITTDQVNYDGNYPYGNAPNGQYREKTTPVGRFPANAWGLHDMHGNVIEWCRDWYAVEFHGNSPTDDPENTKSGAGCVFRGGGWNLIARSCRSAYRSSNNPAHRSNNRGFRLALDIKSPFPLLPF